MANTFPDTQLSTDDTRPFEATDRIEASKPSTADRSTKSASVLMEKANMIGLGDEDGEPIHYLKGLRLQLIMTAFVSMQNSKSPSSVLTQSFARLCVCLFLTNLEIPIVTTSLVGITKELQGFDEASWIISSYLLGYVGIGHYFQPS